MKTNIEKLEIIIKNKIPEIDRVNKLFNGFSKKYGIPLRVQREMNVVLDELLNNIISYGYKDGKEHLIDLDIDLQDHDLKIKISDDAMPFNPLKMSKPNTDLSLSARKAGGLGIYIVRNLMDRITYARENEKNIIYMIKSFKPDKSIKDLINKS
ncbi:ATP-binding protein [Candidatus Riflebacteria bacterium]